MEPTLYRGDFVIVRAVDPTTLQVGDIIIYDPALLLGETPIVHRIIDIHNVSGELRFITKGDNNPGPDGGERTPADVLAKVIGSIRYLGFVTLLLLDPSGFLIVIIIIIFFFVISLVCDFLRPDSETGKAEKPEPLNTKQPDSF